jgi:hypothetical protein
MRPGLLACGKRSTRLVLLSLFVTGTAFAIDLKRETIEAFDQFIASVEARLDANTGKHPFLWSDEFPAMRSQLLQGMVMVQPAQGNGLVPVKNGLVEDWRGAVFIPHATLQEALTVVQDYNRHGEYYKPDIKNARIESHQGDEFQVRTRIVKSKFMLTDVLDVENTIRFTNVDAKRALSKSFSTRINEVTSPGQPGERQLPVGQDRGLLWRLYGYWFLEERDNGVTIAVESITLTRDIPFGLSTVLGPIFREVPGESLKTSLDQTRRAVAASLAKLH